MVETLCHAYHWTLDEAMELTIPQVLMLNHSAHLRYLRQEKQIERIRGGEQPHRDPSGHYSKLEKVDGVMVEVGYTADGRRVSDLNPLEREAYLWAEFGG